MTKNANACGELSAVDAASAEVECFTVARDGFHGFLHRPANDRMPGKAVIVVGGSEGNDRIARGVGSQFAEAGVTALGVCYWNVAGLPSELVEVPIESIERATYYLKSRGFDHIALYGISKGGELALLAGSLVGDISCVVALSPMNYVMCGIAGTRSVMTKKDYPQASSWTWRGCPIKPFVQASGLSRLELARRLVVERQIDTCWAYERALADAPAAAEIAVENIGGPMLLICATDDRMWPSAAACHAIERRLSLRSYQHPLKLLEYRYASHILVPLAPGLLRAFRVEREHPGECAASRRDAFSQTLEFLRAW